MKCELCLREIYLNLRKEFGKDKVAIGARMMAQLGLVSEAITKPWGHGGPVCLHHYIEDL